MDLPPFFEPEEGAGGDLIMLRSSELIPDDVSATGAVYEAETADCRRCSGAALPR